MIRLIGTVDTIKKLDATSPIPVPSTTTVYTRAIPLYGADAFGIELLAASPGVVDVMIQFEESMDEPTTEEAADTNYVIPDGFPDIANLTDEVVHIKQITPIPAKFGRFKLTGQGSNDASTTVRMRLFRQE